MKDIGKEVKTITVEEVLESLKEILQEVAPLKIVDEITPQISLVEDFAFDSIDIMGMLLKIQEKFLKNKSILELDVFLNEMFANEKRFTVQMVCQQLIKIIQREDNPDE